LIVNLIQPSKSAEFHKVNESEDKNSKLIWLKTLNNRVKPNFSKIFINSQFDNKPLDKKSLENNADSLAADLSKNKEELVIQSDKQSEKNKEELVIQSDKQSEKNKEELVIQSVKQFEENNVVNAEGDVSVSYRGKHLKADRLIYDKALKKITAEGNITLIFGEQVFKMSYLEYNLKDQTGYFLNVKGSINTDKLITDLYANFDNSDIKKLDNYLLNLQKKEVLNTPNKLNNWIFSTERISIDGKKWKSNKAIFSNDILQFKQVKIEINSLEAFSLEEELRFRSSLNYLVLDENVSIPFWLGNRALTKTGQNFDSKSSWIIGYDNLDKDGLFFGRKLDSINFSDDFILDLEPQFFIQRSLNGKTKSFVKQGDLITGDKVKRDAEFSDYFGLKSQLKGKLNNWDLEVVNQINSYDMNKFSNALRFKSNLKKEINFLNGKWDQSFYGVYRDRVWNGSLGEAEIYTGYGSKLEKKHTWEAKGILNTEVVSLGLSNIKGEELSSKDLVGSFKGNLFYSLDQNIPLITDNPKNKSIDSSYEYIYEPIKKGLSLNTRLAALYSIYDHGQHQEYIGLGFGPELILGNFRTNAFDYTRISIFPFYKFKNGESVFKFDQIYDKFTLDLGFDQQLFGPLILKSNGTLNLDGGSNDYGNFISSKVALNWKKRSYEFGIFYQPHNQAGGISFSLFGFK